MSILPPSLYMHGPDRTAVIKTPLVRSAMHKGDLAAFLRSRDERRSSRRSALASSRRSASGPSSSRRTAIGGSHEGQVKESPGAAGAVPREGSQELQYSMSMSMGM